MSDDALTIQHVPFLGDWFVVRCADGSRWFESGADVEGDRIDMTELAAAIERGGRYSAKRCHVEVHGAEVSLWSPRNSQSHPRVSLAVAQGLARRIREALATVMS